MSDNGAIIGGSVAAVVVIIVVVVFCVWRCLGRYLFRSQHHFLFLDNTEKI